MFLSHLNVNDGPFYTKELTRILLASAPLPPHMVVDEHIPQVAVTFSNSETRVPENA